jgi:hypothetical protein
MMSGEMTLRSTEPEIAQTKTPCDRDDIIKLIFVGAAPA